MECMLIKFCVEKFSKRFLNAKKYDAHPYHYTRERFPRTNVASSLSVAPRDGAGSERKFWVLPLAHFWALLTDDVERKPFW